MRIRLRKGLDLPIPGAPLQAIESGSTPRSVAMLGEDFPNLRFSLDVDVGDRVRIGQPLFRDRRNAKIRFPSPSSGTVSAVHRGDARRLVAMEIEVGGTDTLEFPAVTLDDLRTSSREKTSDRLLEAGDWIGLRARPFGSIATPGTAPAAIFVRAMDSNPLAVDPAVVLGERPDDFVFGLTALSRLTEGALYVCARPGAIENPARVGDVPRVELVDVIGPHPAGLVGTHIHHLLPVLPDRPVWYVGYQDVLAMGHLFRCGRPDPSRVIALAGPAVQRPRLLRTVIGASSEDLVEGELSTERSRIISGSVLAGRTAARPGAFLGRYHEQLCAIAERAPAKSNGRFIPGWKRARLVPFWRAAPDWSNESHGQQCGFYPLDLFDRAFPLRLPLSPLLRALAAGDARAAAAFGALELEEEDLALASYLCPAKLDYGPLLRSVLDELEGDASVNSSESNSPGAHAYVTSDLAMVAPHVRSPMNMTIVMRCILAASAPCVLMALYNTGYQVNLALENGAALSGWRPQLLAMLGVGHSPTNPLDCMLLGSLFFVPLLMTSWLAGRVSEAGFARARGRRQDHIALPVIALLFALGLPATLPLWQAALGCAIGIVFGREIFGGFGHNFVNPVVLGLAFLYFAYPGAMSGDGIWVPVSEQTGPTLLAIASRSGLEGLAASGVTWSSAALGWVPGAMGETSALACLLGSLVLLYTGVASWRIVVAGCLGLWVGVGALQFAGAASPIAELPWHWHLVSGGFAFGIVYLATDPVTAATTNPGRWLYGAIIGLCVAGVRIANPAHQDGVILALLMGNVSAPLLDRAVALVQVRFHRGAGSG